jgi:hypothetical protein
MGVGVFASSPQILSLSCSPSSPPSSSFCCCPSSLEVILADVGGGVGGQSLTRRASDIAAIVAVAASASSSPSSSCLELVLLKDGRRSSLTRRVSDVAAMAGSVGFLQAELKSLKNSPAAAATAAPSKLTTGSSLRRSLSSGPSLLLLRRVSQECGTDPIFRSKSSGNSRDVGRCVCKALKFSGAETSHQGDDEDGGGCGYESVLKRRVEDQQDQFLEEERRRDPAFQGSSSSSSSMWQCAKFGSERLQEDVDLQCNPAPISREEILPKMSLPWSTSHHRRATSSKDALRAFDERGGGGLSKGFEDGAGCLKKMNRFETPRPSLWQGADMKLVSSSSPPPPSSSPSPSSSLLSSPSKKLKSSLCGLAYQVEGGAQLPVSLRKLKRRHVEGKGTAAQESDCGCSIRKAFASMVFMIGAMQSYVLQMRQALFSEWDVQEVLFLVHQELNTSFVWLFQQVFACTPKLMVSVMILLANFTVFSMGERIAVAAEVFNPPSAIIMSALEEQQAGLGMDSDAEEFAARALSSGFCIEDTPEVAGGGNGSSGGNNSKPVSVAGDSGGDSWLGMLSRRNTMFSEKDSGLESCAPGQVSDPSGFGSSQSSSSSSFSASSGSPVVKESAVGAVGSDSFSGHKVGAQDQGERISDKAMLQALLEETAKELELRIGEPLQHVKLDQETIRRLVAPVAVDLEPDNYSCFDRTDLEYQHAISMQDTNTLLLANYAQFLYVVRHDNNRLVFHLPARFSLRTKGIHFLL